MILALNETRKTLLASRVGVQRNVRSRPAEQGAQLLPGEGFWVERCQAVDPAGMLSPVDLLFLDENHYVIESVTALRPDAPPSVVPGAFGVLELPAGTIPASRTRKGDHVSIEDVGLEAEARPLAARGQTLSCGPTSSK